MMSVLKHNQDVELKNVDIMKNPHGGGEEGGTTQRQRAEGGGWRQRAGNLRPHRPM
jgi:hypothetical protein